jgi:hypothetical protein
MMEYGEEGRAHGNITDRAEEGIWIRTDIS